MVPLHCAIAERSLQGVEKRWNLKSWLWRYLAVAAETIVSLHAVRPLLRAAATRWRQSQRLEFIVFPRLKLNFSHRVLVGSPVPCVFIAPLADDIRCPMSRSARRNDVRISATSEIGGICGIMRVAKKEVKTRSCWSLVRIWTCMGVSPESTSSCWPRCQQLILRPLKQNTGQVTTRDQKGPEVATDCHTQRAILDVLQVALSKEQLRDYLKQGLIFTKWLFTRCPI